MGNGAEVLKAANEKIIEKAIGCSYLVDDSEIFDNITIKNKVLMNFRGVEARCDNFYNYASFSTHVKAGFFSYWVNFTPYMVYPAQEGQSYMALEQVAALKEILMVLRDYVDDYKKMNPTMTEFRLNSPTRLFQHAGLTEKELSDALMESTEKIIKTNNINTFMCALEMLLLMGKSDPDYLKSIAKTPPFSIHDDDIHRNTQALLKKHDLLIKELT